MVKNQSLLRVRRPRSAARAKAAVIAPNYFSSRTSTLLWRGDNVRNNVTLVVGSYSICPHRLHTQWLKVSGLELSVLSHSELCVHTSFDCRVWRRTCISLFPISGNFHVLINLIKIYISSCTVLPIDPTCWKRPSSRDRNMSLLLEVSLPEGWLTMLLLPKPS